MISDICHKWDMWRISLSCGKISDFLTWQMWRNLNFSTSVMWRYFRFLHRTGVENSENILHAEKFQMSPEHRCFFLQFTLFCRESVLSWCTFFEWRKIETKFAYVEREKITNIRYISTTVIGNEHLRLNLAWGYKAYCTS